VVAVMAGAEAAMAVGARSAAVVVGVMAAAVAMVASVADAKSRRRFFVKRSRILGRFLFTGRLLPNEKR